MIETTHPLDNTNGFNSQIHVYRAKQRMSQQELADRVGLSRQTIIQLERNRYNPSLRVAVKIARLFHVPVEQILPIADNFDDQL